MTKVNSYIRISPQVAFGNGPWDANPTFTDISPYLRDDGQVRIDRGRSNEFSKFEPGKVSGLILDNRTRLFDPNYASSPAPFSGNIQPSKQMQLLAEYPWLPGLLPDDNLRNTGWSVYGGTGGPTTYDQAGSTYDTGVYDSAGNASLALVSGDAPAGIHLQRALKVTVNSSTQAGIQSPVMAAVPGQKLTVTARVKFTSPAAGGPMQQMVQLNFFQANGNVSAITPSATASVAVAKSVWGDGNWSLITLTGVVVPNDAATFTVTLFTNVYQAADVTYWDAIVVDYASTWIQKVISYTYVDDWKLTYKGRDAICTVNSSDAFAAFSTKDLTNVTYETTVAGLANLRHYWTFGERADWVNPYTQEYAPGNARLLTKRFVGWGVPGPVLTDLTTGVGLTDDQTLTIGGWFDMQALANPATATAWTIGFWCQQAAATDRIFDFGQGGDVNDQVANSGGIPNKNFITLYCNDAASPPTKLRLAAQTYAANNSNPTGDLNCSFTPPPNVIDPRVPAYTTPGTFFDGAWHFVVITLDATHINFNFWVDGQQVQPTIVTSEGSLSGKTAVATGAINFPTNAIALFGGSQGVPGYTGQLAHLMVLDRAISSSEIANLYSIAQQQWFGQTPQSRINAVLDTVAFPSAMRKLDVGSSTLNAETGNLSQTNALQYMQYVEDSEAGWLFVDMGGYVNLMGRLTMVKASGTTPQWTLGDLWPQNPSVELPILESPDLDNSNTLIYTEAEGSMGTGSVGSVNNKTSGTLYYFADTTTLVNQGKRSISKTNLLNTTESEVYSILQYWVTMYKTPKQRIQKIKVMPVGTDELWQFVLGVEIGQVVQVNLRPPPGGSTMTSLVGRVQHVTHTFGQRRWETEIELATVDVGKYLNLDNPTSGKLDSGNMLFF